MFKSILSAGRACFSGLCVTAIATAWLVLPAAPIVFLATAAHAICAPAAATSVVAICSGLTVDQNGVNGFGTGVETDVTLTIEPSASVTGTNVGIGLQEVTNLVNFGTVTSGVNGIGIGTIGSLTNLGLITGGVSGLGAGSIVSLTNIGTITSGVTGLFSTSIASLNNYGTISGDREGIVAFNDITSWTPARTH